MVARDIEAVEFVAIAVGVLMGMFYAVAFIGWLITVPIMDAGFFDAEAAVCSARSFVECQLTFYAPDSLLGFFFYGCMALGIGAAVIIGLALLFNPMRLSASKSRHKLL